MEEILINYIDQTLSAEERAKVEVMLKTQPGLRQKLAEMQQLNALMQQEKMLEPSTASKDRFEVWLAEEKSPNLTVRFRNWNKQWAIAASILLILSLAFLINNQRQMSTMQQELMAQRQMMFDLLTQESVSGRVQAVRLAMDAPQADEALLSTLEKVLQTDKNATVQLTAIDALQQFSNQPEVQQILLNALQNEEHKAVVKIALIHTLIDFKNQPVVDELQKLINHPMSAQAVKDEAHFALIQLGEPL
ncbi:MAG: HEAT repeat domain-containing protein [Bacteroidota bacterium]